MSNIEIPIDAIVAQLTPLIDAAKAAAIEEASDALGSRIDTTAASVAALRVEALASIASMEKDHESLQSELSASAQTAVQNAASALSAVDGISDAIKAELRVNDGVQAILSRLTVVEGSLAVVSGVQNKLLAALASLSK